MSSRYEELLQALLNGETADIVPRSRLEATLKNCIEGCGCDGLPEPQSRSEAYLQALAEKMKGGGGGNTGGGVGIIDVTELPTENIVEKAPYRVQQQSVELYVVGIQDTPIPYLQTMREQAGATINVEIVETLPETLTPVDHENMILPLYVIKSTGIAYADAGGGAMPFGQAIFNTEGLDKGWSTDVNTETEQGVYTYALVEYTLSIFTNGEWDVYVDDAYKEEATALRQENASMFNELDRLASENTNLKGSNEYLQGRVKELTPYANFGQCAVLAGTDDGVSLTAVWNAGIESIAMPNNEIQSIGSCAFQGFTALKSVLLPMGLKSIGQQAFDGCINLTNIEIMGGLELIDNFAFNNCQKLTSINFDGVKESWKLIVKGAGWDDGTPDYIITCADGTIAKDGTET